MIELIDWERIFPIQVLAVATFAFRGIRLQIGTIWLHLALLGISQLLIVPKVVDDLLEGKPFIGYFATNELYAAGSVIFLGFLVSMIYCLILALRS